MSNSETSPTIQRVFHRCAGCNGLGVFTENGHVYFLDGYEHKDDHHAVQLLEDLEHSVQKQVTAQWLKNGELNPNGHPELVSRNEADKSTPSQHSTAEGEALGKDPALLYKIKLALDKPIFREDPNKLLLFAICVSSITSRPLAACITSESAAGKSNLLHGVIKYFPNVDYFTRLTTASLDRLEKNLTGRILVVEEMRGADAAQGTLRVAISEGKLRLLTTDRDDHGHIITREIETKGTPGFITTTTSTALDWETQTRLLMLSCDETQLQTEGVLRYEAREFMGLKEKETPDKVVSEYLSSLLPYYEVLVPFADQLVNNFPSNRLSARRDFKKLLNLVALIAWMHQHQRTRVRKKSDPTRSFVVATPMDLAYALLIAGPSLRQNLAGVPDRVLSLLQFFKPGEMQTTRSIMKLAKIAQRTARRWMGEDLVQAGYLTVDETGREHLYYLVEGDAPTASTRLLVEVPPEIACWTMPETNAWLDRSNFEIEQTAEPPTWVDPFTGDLTLPASLCERPLAASETAVEIAAGNGQTADNTARPPKTANISPFGDAANGQDTPITDQGAA